MSKKLSIIIPCYNGEKFLRKSVNSMLQQTLQPSKIYLINDGSSDDTHSIIEEYAQNNSHIVAVQYTKNRGKAAVLNEILSDIEETYIVLQDADDIAHPNRLERQILFMENHPEVGCSSSFIRYINESGRVIGKGQLDILSRKKYDTYLKSEDPFGLFCPAVILRSAVFGNPSLRFRHQFWPADDIDLWNRIAESGWQVLAQPEYLVDYRIHGASAVTSGFQKTREKYEFVRACLRARRRQEEEPDWETFQTLRKNRSFFVKLNDGRKALAKGFYRNAGFQWGAGKKIKAIITLLSATFLQPGYVLPRLCKQFM